MLLFRGKALNMLLSSGCHSGALLPLVIFAAATLGATNVFGAADSPNEACKPTLVLETRAGNIEVELHQAAAPQTVRRLMALIAGPIYNPDLVPAMQSGRPPGFYDGLAFNFVRPHIEIVTETREPSAAFSFANEIDAKALALDKLLIENRAEAMSVMQRELLVDYHQKKKRGRVTDDLQAWLDLWYKDYSADFLIGVSRQEINEALGYTYQDNLASRPASRGSVSLQPESPDYSTARLTILLNNVPERTGRWMVIGSVVKGIEVAEEISVRPLACECAAESSRPVQPVVIETARITCR